ncbi:hypothetical protein PVOR_03600 [Paenibacillus vortex V453]|uniref:Uncharacterized protein n=1 Tax=Paenibacillus vortex V453 TaxID=715225 RepID=A0A2R9T131_9BACL|nr:hypothetical protein PVOR_03600 [Paenibacillus vortex V453]
MTSMLNWGNYTIQRSGSKFPTLKINFQAHRCVQIHNGIQFHVNCGYIDIDFDEYINNKEITYRIYQLEFYLTMSLVVIAFILQFLNSDKFF